MVIMTAKLSKGKLLAALLILVVLIVATIAICTGESSAPPQTGPNVTAATNEDRLAFLSGFGWNVSVDPVDTQQVRIPDQPSEVFDRYNDLQKSQGFDLSQYAGQTATRYVYEILNYEAVPSAGCFVAGAATPESLATAAQPQDSDAPAQDGEAPAQDAAEAAPSLESGAAPTVDNNNSYVTDTVPIYATLLVCDGVIIGGDVSSADPSGIMHGFAKP